MSETTEQMMQKKVESVKAPVQSDTEKALAEGHLNSKKDDHTTFYGRRNARRFLNLGGQYVPWREKTRIQGLCNMLVGYVAQLELEVKRLMEKNNELISPSKTEEKK